MANDGDGVRSAENDGNDDNVENDDPDVFSQAHVWTVCDVARFLHLSKNTVMLRARMGEIRGRKIGGQWRFLADTIRGMLPPP